MATAAVALVEIRPTGTASVQGAFGAVKKSAEDLGRQGSTAVRTMAQSLASVADAGKLSAGSMATVLGQLGDLAVGFGAGGPLVGALAVASGAMVKLFADSRDEIVKTRQKAQEELRTLALDADATATESAARRQQRVVLDAQEQVGIARRALEQVKIAAENAGEQGAGMRSTVAAAEARLASAQQALNEAMNRQATLNALLLQQKQEEFRSEQALLNIHRLEAEAAKASEASSPAARAKGIATEVDALAALAKASALTSDDRKAAIALEARLTAAMNAGNVSRAERAALETQLHALMSSGALLAAPTVTSTDATGAEAEYTKQVDAMLAAQARAINKRIRVSPLGIGGINFAADAEKLKADISKQFALAIASGVTDGITAGFEAGFASGSVGKGFEEMARTLVTGLGGAMEQFGAASLIAATGMARIRISLMSFNPVAAIAASLAFIAAGAALKSLAGPASSAFSGPFDGSSGSSYAPPVQRPDDIVRVTLGPTSATTAAGMQPVQPITVNLFGPNDPKVQRDLMNTIRNAQRRGL